VYGIACGYPDCNDSARLADDPIQKLMLDRDPIEGDQLGSQPTLSRFENSVSSKDLFKLGGELADGIIDVWAKPFVAPQVALRPQRCDAILGMNIPAERQVEYLRRLGLQPQAQKDRVICTIPSYRRDLSREIGSGGGSLSMRLRVAQIVYTLTQFEGVTDRVNYEPEEAENQAARLLRMAIDNFPKRHGKVEPIVGQRVGKAVVGFSTDSIVRASAPGTCPCKGRAPSGPVPRGCHAAEQSVRKG
jgi:hypothetical protein